MITRVARLAVVVWALTGLGCSGNGAQELYETAQLEERQNNPAHAKELYQEILIKHPQSEYARKADEVRVPIELRSSHNWKQTFFKQVPALCF